MLVASLSYWLSFTIHLSFCVVIGEVAFHIWEWAVRTGSISLQSVIWRYFIHATQYPDFSVFPQSIVFLTIPSKLSFQLTVSGLGPMYSALLHCDFLFCATKAL